MANVILIGCILCYSTFVLYRKIKRRKEGKGCGCGCASCGMSGECHKIYKDEK